MLSKKDKEDILNQFLQVASKYLRTIFTNYFVQKRNLKLYFKKILGKRNSLNHQLHVNQYYDGWMGNIYDCLGLTNFEATYQNHADRHLLSKCIINIINKCHLSNSDFIKIQQLSKSNKTFVNWATPITQHHQRKYNHYLGVLWIVAILLISLIIPNHAINLTGITFSNFFIYIGHFLLIQFENLINPALIGRLLINVIGDVPVVKHYFLNNR